MNVVSWIEQQRFDGWLVGRLPWKVQSRLQVNGEYESDVMKWKIYG